MTFWKFMRILCVCVAVLWSVAVVADAIRTHWHEAWKDLGYVVVFILASYGCLHFEEEKADA